MSDSLAKLINIKDFELAAKSALSQSAYDYYAGGACDEITLAANEKAYSNLCIKYHVLRDVSNRTTKTKVIGQQINSPIIIGPTAFHALACAEGELATARAAKNNGAVFTLSTLSNCSMEEIANDEKAGGNDSHLWYQLYVYRNRDISKKLVEMAYKLDCKALVITVDSQIAGRRERDIRNAFQLPPEIKAGNLDIIQDHVCIDQDATGISDQTSIHAQNSLNSLAQRINNLCDQSLSWKDIEWFRSLTNLPILIKGIVRADDALRAVDCGINGIVVSNHGGRSLDTSPSTLSVLPEIVSAVGKKVDILLDGGIRRGTDVLKALALGAKAVMIGRPILWGLAVGGEAGVSKVLQILNDEFDLAMALSGCQSPAEISPDLIGPMA